MASQRRMAGGNIVHYYAVTSPDQVIGSADLKVPANGADSLSHLTVFCCPDGQQVPDGGTTLMLLGWEPSAHLVMARRFLQEVSRLKQFPDRRVAVRLNGGFCFFEKGATRLTRLMDALDPRSRTLCARIWRTIDIQQPDMTDGCLLASQ